MSQNNTRWSRDTPGLWPGVLERESADQLNIYKFCGMYMDWAMGLKGQRLRCEGHIFVNMSLNVSFSFLAMLRRILNRVGRLLVFGTELYELGAQWNSGGSLPPMWSRSAY